MSALSTAVRPPACLPAVRLPVLSNARPQPRGTIRRRGRSRWQARVWCAEFDSWVNVGVYETEEAASQVARKVLRAVLGTTPSPPHPAAARGTVTPLAVWRAARKLADAGWDVDGQLGSLLPSYVKPDRRGGFGYSIGGRNGCKVGGYATPEEAYKAAVMARRRAARAAARDSEGGRAVGQVGHLAVQP